MLQSSRFANYLNIEGPSPEAFQVFDSEIRWVKLVSPIGFFLTFSDESLYVLLESEKVATFPKESYLGFAAEDRTDFINKLTLPAESTDYVPLRNFLLSQTKELQA